jgi:hypothetical protein
MTTVMRVWRASSASSTRRLSIAPRRKSVAWAGKSAMAIGVSGNSMMSCKNSSLERVASTKAASGNRLLRVRCSASQSTAATGIPANLAQARIISKTSGLADASAGLKTGDETVEYF